MRREKKEMVWKTSSKIEKMRREKKRKREEFDGKICTTKSKNPNSET